MKDYHGWQIGKVTYYYANKEGFEEIVDSDLKTLKKFINQEENSKGEGNLPKDSLKKVK